MAVYENKNSNDAPFFTLNKWLETFSNLDYVGRPGLQSPTFNDGATKARWFIQRMGTSYRVNYAEGSDLNKMAGSFECADSAALPWVARNDRFRFDGLDTAGTQYNSYPIIGLVEFVTVQQWAAERFNSSGPFYVLQDFVVDNFMFDNLNQQDSSNPYWVKITIGEVMNWWDDYKDFVIPKITWYSGPPGSRTALTGTEQNLCPFLFATSPNQGHYSYSDGNITFNQEQASGVFGDLIAPPYYPSGRDWNYGCSFGSIISDHFYVSNFSAGVVTPSEAEWHFQPGPYFRAPWVSNKDGYSRILVGTPPTTGDVTLGDALSRYNAVKNDTTGSFETWHRVTRGPSGLASTDYWNWLPIFCYYNAASCKRFFLNEWGITLAESTAEIQTIGYGTPSNPNTGGGTSGPDVPGGGQGTIGGGGGGGVVDNPYIPGGYIDNTTDTIQASQPLANASNLGRMWIFSTSNYLNMMNWLNTPDVFSAFKVWFADPKEALLGIRIYPCNLVAHDTAHTSFAEFQLYGESSGINTNYISGAYNFEFSGGTFKLDARNTDWRDIACTKYQLFIPYVGIIDVDPASVVGRTLEIKYRVNLGTGVSTCFVFSNGSYNGEDGEENAATRVVYTTTCEVGEALPWLASDAKDVSRNAILAALKAGVGAISGAATQDYTAAAEGTLSMVSGAITNTKITGSIRGNLGSSPYIMAPFIQVTRYPVSTPEAWYRTMGTPCSRIDTVENLLSGEGFCKIDNVSIDTWATDEERDEILRLLSEGIRS